MKKLLYLPVLLLFIGCSPKVTTSVSSRYTPLNAYDPVVVYKSRIDLPEEYKVLGEISVKDNGLSVKCDYVTVMGIIKNESRKVGGNAVLITQYKKPSFLGGSCHQMSGNFLKIPDSDTGQVKLQLKDNTNNMAYSQPVSYNVTKKNELPKVKITGNIGYGWRTAKIAESFSDFQEKLAKGIKNGLTWDAGLAYYFNDYVGVGVVYSGYAASASEQGYDIITRETGTFKVKDNITFIGPAFTARFFSNPQWLFNIDVGIGYITYKSKQNVTMFRKESSLTMKGSNLGLYSSAGVEYKFARQWGIGANLSALGGSLSNVTVTQNGQKYDEELDSKESLNTLRLTLGLRYYF